MGHELALQEEATSGRYPGSDVVDSSSTFDSGISEATLSDTDSSTLTDCLDESIDSICRNTPVKDANCSTGDLTPSDIMDICISD